MRTHQNTGEIKDFDAGQWSFSCAAHELTSSTGLAFVDMATSLDAIASVGITL
jgi:hypothetical protein